MSRLANLISALLGVSRHAAHVSSSLNENKVLLTVAGTLLGGGAAWAGWAAASLQMYELERQLVSISHKLEEQQLQEANRRKGAQDSGKLLYFVLPAAGALGAVVGLRAGTRHGALLAAKARDLGRMREQRTQELAALTGEKARELAQLTEAKARELQAFRARQESILRERLRQRRERRAQQSSGEPPDPAPPSDGPGSHL